MKEIPFVKYTLHGNKFVIIDETENLILSEEEKSRFAYQATDIYYGIGSDNFLVVQACTPEILNKINESRNYWKELPRSDDADFIFRMFEPDGKEALCCGNGLLCISNYLYKKYGITTARIMTEIPRSVPKVLSIGTDLQTKLNWSNMGIPCRIPEKLVNPRIARPRHAQFDVMYGLDIFFSQNGLAFDFKGETSLKISGFLTFTGEPHLVIFTEVGFSSEKIASYIFHAQRKKRGITDFEKVQSDVSSRLVHQIGMCLNKDYSEFFPQGLNINFVRILNPSGMIEYRCFERGIYRETWACGTGAVAIAFIAEHLNLIYGDQVTIFPYVSRLHDAKARLMVKNNNNEYFLYGTPLFLLEGTFFQKRMKK